MKNREAKHFFLLYSMVLRVWAAAAFAAGDPVPTEFPAPKFHHAVCAWASQTSPAHLSSRANLTAIFCLFPTTTTIMTHSSSTFEKNYLHENIRSYFPFSQNDYWNNTAILYKSPN